MATRKYTLIQPTQIDDHLDFNPSPTNQFNQMKIDIRAGRYSDDHCLSNDNQRRTPVILSSNLQSWMNTVRKLNSAQTMTDSQRTHPIIERPSPPAKRNKHRCAYNYCDCDENSFCCSCCLASSKPCCRSSHLCKSSSSGSTSCDCCCCTVCYDNQSVSADINGQNNGGSDSGCCSDGGCCDCDECDCGGCDCGGCDCGGCDCGDCILAVCLGICCICFAE